VTPFTDTDSFTCRHIRRCRRPRIRREIAFSGKFQHTGQCRDRQIDLSAEEVRDDLRSSSVRHGDQIDPRSRHECRRSKCLQ